MGVPKVQRLTKIDGQILVERITTKTRWWPVQKHSYAGKVQLIQTVLISMFAY